MTDLREIVFALNRQEITSSRALEMLNERATERIKNKIEKVESIHPYKELGNRNSYSEFNEGWSDALGTLESELSK